MRSFQKRSSSVSKWSRSAYRMHLSFSQASLNWIFSAIILNTKMKECMLFVKLFKFTLFSHSMVRIAKIVIYGFVFFYKLIVPLLIINKSQGRPSIQWAPNAKKVCGIMKSFFVTYCWRLRFCYFFQFFFYGSQFVTQMNHLWRISNGRWLEAAQKSTDIAASECINSVVL